MVDANTYFIDRHLQEIDDHEAKERLDWPTCNDCGEQIDPDFYCSENDLCDECNAPSPAEMEAMRQLHHGEKMAGLLRPQSEIDDDLRLAGLGHLCR